MVFIRKIHIHAKNFEIESIFKPINPKVAAGKIIYNRD